MTVPVAIFAKPPVPGRVKTRLARDVGDVVAAEVAEALLQDAWSAACACAWARPVLATPDVAADHGIGRVEAWDQGGGDLGARVARILARGVDEADACLAVGADTAGLTPARLDAVRDALATAPAVLGPSDDGGFWVLAVRAVPEGLLADLPWSAPDTCAATAARLEARLGRVVRVSPGFDVDVRADLMRWVREADAGRAPEGHTVALGRRLRDDAARH